MLIVVQEGDVMVDFDNVENTDIVADLDGTGEVLYKIYYETSSGRERLGKYKTEERAKEVLEQIIEQYELSERLKEGRGISLGNCNNYVYRMPKE